MLEKINFTINGDSVTLEVDPEWMLIDIIREMLDLTGTKRGCDNATCGTCVVVLNGRAIKSCNTPVKKAAGCEILTVEGLSQGRSLHPVQKAFAESGAVQCGFCTPGIVMSAVHLLAAHPRPTPDEVREALSGNLCRCTGYGAIVRALAAPEAASEEETP